MRRYFTEVEDLYIKANYNKLPSSIIGKKLNRIPSVIRLRTKLLGLKVPADKLKEFNDRTRFTKGHISFNKGKKREEYMTAEAIRVSERFWYKKGHKPHNQKEADGAITKRNYKGLLYYFIRVSVGNWVHHHRYLWEQHNGPIPPLTNVIFKDGNTMNCVIENLELLTNVELMARNTIHNMPPELKEIVNITRRINNKIKKLKKNNDEK